MHFLDFIVWPKLRDFAVQSSALQEDMEWMVELANTIRCHWPHAIEDAIQKDPKTGQDALTDFAKV